VEGARRAPVRVRPDFELVVFARHKTNVASAGV
jgi:hypothetical protein